MILEKKTKMGVVLQNEEPEVKIYEVVDNPVPNNVIASKNKARKWEYGYDSKYDFVVISKDGTIGDVYDIQGLRVALPATPSKPYSRSKSESKQYWEPFEFPKEIESIKSLAHWNKKPKAFKDKWGPYIDAEFDRRDKGMWFMNNGTPTYITGSNYMYLQWSNIDVGLPDFREANRILWLFWEGCKADYRSFGMCYLKIRRSGASFMGASECANIGTLSRNSKLGILSKTGEDAKSLFVDKLVPLYSRYPFFFKPIQAGMDRPKTELQFKVPASKITKRNMFEFDEEDDVKGLNTTINWKSTQNNSYDSEKLIYLLHDESGKWLKPNSIKKNYRVTKTCLRLGRKVIGKCFMVSTSNALDEGGEEFKDLYNDSKIETRNKNGQTKSGLYALYIPTEWNLEGYIDIYGMPVLRTPDEPVLGIDGDMILEGAIDWWENEVESKKSDPDDLNEFYRQYSRTEAHAFRDESKNSLFNLTKIYQQIDYNDGFIKSQVLTRGSFVWDDGKKDTRVIFTPDPRGRFLVSWVPDKSLQNNIYEKRGVKYPGNVDLGSFGCDSYDISGTVGGGGSKGSLHGLTKFNMDAKVPSNEFFLEYIARPQMAEIFFEDVLKAIVFYGMPILAENNKPRLLYHLKNRGYRGFSMERPDKERHKLSKSEVELGGIPNTSTDVKLAHSEAIEYYIERYVGLDEDGLYREAGSMGNMPFNKTLNDWARFDINKRTEFDASISSGLAIMANLRHLYRPVKTSSKININFARYDNTGSQSQIILNERK